MSPPVLKTITVLQDGSDRVFYRVEINSKIYILLKETRKCRFNQFIRISFIFPNTPQIYDINYEKMEILMEDLGDTSLYNYIQQTRDYTIYFKVIDLLKEIQSIEKATLPKFDIEHLIWEVDYFLNFYPQYSHLKEPLYNNAIKVAEIPLVPMHRDFQSRNIFIKEGKIRIIDFQNAHIGPIIYDVASLLNDPYVNLESEIINEFLNYYTNDKELINHFKYVSIQRLAQTSAAFKKLSYSKPFFKKFIEISLNKLFSLL